jgi:hypothetical protein
MPQLVVLAALAVESHGYILGAHMKKRTHTT